MQCFTGVMPCSQNRMIRQFTRDSWISKWINHGSLRVCSLNHPSEICLDSFSKVMALKSFKQGNHSTNGNDSPMESHPRILRGHNCRSLVGLSENRVYPQWNSHLVGIMISKTIGFRGTQHFQTNPCRHTPHQKKNGCHRAVSQVCGRERWHPRWKHGALPASSGSRVIRRMALTNHGKMIRKWWENHGKIVGKWWDNHGKTMGKWWENDGNIMEKSLENHGKNMEKTMGKWWENDGKIMGKSWENR